MVCPFFFDGIVVKTSAKGSLYAEVYTRGMDADGNADFVQKRFMSFDEEVISKLQKCKKDDVVNLGLEVKDATISSVNS